MAATTARLRTRRMISITWASIKVHRVCYVDPGPWTLDPGPWTLDPEP
jgi:hypothetical protein